MKHLKKKEERQKVERREDLGKDHMEKGEEGRWGGARMKHTGK